MRIKLQKMGLQTGGNRQHQLILLKNAGVTQANFIGALVKPPCKFLQSQTKKQILKTPSSTQFEDNTI